jgi:hypothetical protein
MAAQTMLCTRTVIWQNIEKAFKDKGASNACCGTGNLRFDVMVGCCVELVAGLYLQRLTSCSLFLNLGGLIAVLEGGSREPSKLGRQQNKSSQVSLQDPAAGCQLFCAGVPVQLQHTSPVTEASPQWIRQLARKKQTQARVGCGFRSCWADTTCWCPYSKLSDWNYPSKFQDAV